MTDTGITPSRFAVWSAAHALVRVEEYAFDFLLYPYMLLSGGETLLRMLGLARADAAILGFWAGFAVLTLASLTLNLLYLALYDRVRSDWFGFEYLKSRLVRLPERLAFVGLVGRCGFFVYLSIWHSPMFATLWVRSSSYTMSRRDWCHFGVAVALANVGWALVVSVSAYAVWLVVRISV